MFELVAGVLLSAAAVYYVLRPIFRPEPAPPARGAADLDSDDPEDDVSPRAQALRALREIEFDRATGKLSDADYDALRAQFTALALDALRAEAGVPAAGRRPPAEQAGARRTAHDARCPVHGPRPESDSAYCSVCGRRLGAAPGYCTHCGTILQAEARFCSRCGTAVMESAV